MQPKLVLRSVSEKVKTLLSTDNVPCTLKVDTYWDEFGKGRERDPFVPLGGPSNIARSDTAFYAMSTCLPRFNRV